jgi:hypothetical protein
VEAHISPVLRQLVTVEALTVTMRACSMHFREHRTEVPPQGSSWRDARVVDDVLLHSSSGYVHDDDIDGTAVLIRAIS